jgi:hypothetical protein
VLSDFIIVDEDRTMTGSRRYGFPMNKCLKMEDICCMEPFLEMQMHAVTYRLKNLIGLKYKQTEGISYTDQQWICMPMSVVDTVYCFEKPVYKYLVGRSGQTMDPQVTRRQMSHFIKCSIGMVDAYKMQVHDIGRNVKEYLKHRIITQLKSIYVTGFTELPPWEANKHLLPLDQYLKSNAFDIYELVQRTNKRVNYIKLWRVLPKLNTYILRCFTILLKVIN